MTLQFFVFILTTKYLFTNWYLINNPLCLVPIIPSFLYETEHVNENTSVVLMSSFSASNSSFASIYSFYDNATILSGHSNQQGIANKTPEAPNNASCNRQTSVLQKENVQVGLLFASKAIVQLLVNPIVGIITNRYMLLVGWRCRFRSPAIIHLLRHSHFLF